MKRKNQFDISIRVICFLLFVVFSFLYIYMFQSERLALMQDHLAQGLTNNNAFVTAALITLLLMALQSLLNRAGKLHGNFEALSYLPSCVVLALITKIDNTFSYSWVQWGLTLLLAFSVYILIVWIDRNSLQLRGEKFLKQLTPNMGVMAALFIFVGSFGCNDSVKTMELAAWKHLHSGDYDKVLNVGSESDECDAQLTSLRNLALAKTGQLGDKLFAYPQPYGANGLLMNRYNMQTPQYGAEEFYDILGGSPYGGEKAAAFYKRMMQKENSAYYRDLYAASLLLDKDLESFAALTVANGKTTSSNLPVHTQEAWMVYNEQHPFSPIAFVPDEAVAQRYREYITLREAHADEPVVMRNLCKRNYGKTYWYYYDFVH